MNIAKAVMNIQNLIDQLATLNASLAEITGAEDLPAKNTPAQPEPWQQVEEKLKITLPDSYKEFLAYTNGYKNITTSYNLLGTADFLSNEYAARVGEIERLFRGEPKAKGLLFGYSPETDTFLFFERLGAHWLVHLSDPDVSVTYISFEAFLRNEIVAAEAAISAIKHMHRHPGQHDDEQEADALEDWLQVQKEIKALEDKATQYKSTFSAESNLTALKLLDEVLKLCAKHAHNKYYDPLSMLKAQYAKLWIYDQLAYRMASVSVVDKGQFKLLLLQQSALCLGVENRDIYLSNDVPHESFRRRWLCYAANVVAWDMYENHIDTLALERALEIITWGSRYAHGPSFSYVWDTKVQILLKLNRQDEAFEIVHCLLTDDPSFGDFQVFRKDKAFIQWKKDKRL